MVNKKQKYLWRNRTRHFGEARNRYWQADKNVPLSREQRDALQKIKDLIATGLSAIHVTVAQGTVHERALSGDLGTTNPGDNL